jgi:hypothetical protein
MMYFIATKLAADPKADGKLQYEALTNAITALGPWSDRLDKCWIVESKLPADRIRTLLKPHLLKDDRLFVGQFTGNWAGFNMGPKFPEWIKRRDFTTPG